MLYEVITESIDRLVSAARDSDVRITLTRAPAPRDKGTVPDDRTRDLAEAVRARDPLLPIIIASGYTDGRLDMDLV